ncbi:MAG TPA: TraR/DksA C4-type zinc finger protein [Chloroflexota bacterium]|nr:TraR/DksA C4-type zinc finger protein [Chloroflexota bacterium]
MADKQPKDLDPQRTRLVEMRTQLELDIETSRHRAMNLSGGPDEPGSGQNWEHTGQGDHQADEATELFEREKELGLEQTLEAHLSQVTHALQRIDTGTYGQCERCEKPISPARLQAMPEATLCIECKAEEEQNVPAGRRQDADPVTFKAAGEG